MIILKRSSTIENDYKKFGIFIILPFLNKYQRTLGALPTIKFIIILTTYPESTQFEGPSKQLRSRANKISPLFSSSSMKNNSKTLGIIVDKIQADIIGILQDLILFQGGPTSVTQEIIYANPRESSIARKAGCRPLNQSTAISYCKAQQRVNCLFSSFFSSFYIFYFFNSFSMFKVSSVDIAKNLIIKLSLIFEYKTYIENETQTYPLKIIMNNPSVSSLKQSRPEVLIEGLKQIVKRFKNQGFQSLTHHDLAVALSTVGFAEVCKQFGAIWTIKCEKQALKILTNSDYDLSWYGKTNNLKYTNFLILCSRGDIQKIKQFMSTLNAEGKKQLFTTVDNFKRNSLHIAVKEGYDVLAQYLINEGFPLNSRDRQLKTPLHYCKNQLICQVLINKKAKVIVKDNKMCTPVHYIASGADYKCLQILLKAANVVNQKDATGKTALFYAIYNTSEEQVNIIRVLLQNGAKVNEQDIFGKTPLHYAAEIGKSRCIPILLRKGASVDAKDKHGKTPIDLAEGQQKVKKIILAYCNNKGVIFEQEQQDKRKQLKKIEQINENETKQNQQGLKNKSKVKQSSFNSRQGQSQIYTKQINQVSTWVREKFFVLMKKLQQSGVKAMWHLKKPYIFTGSWAQDVESLEDLYETLLNINGPEAALRTFNLLCPYEKPLPAVLGKSEQAFHSFFGDSWFSNDPVEKLRNLHSSSKIRTQLQIKMKQAEDLKTQLIGYRSEIQSLQSKIMNLNEQISHYKKVQDDLRKQKNKNNQQYTQILRLMSENQQVKTQLNNLIGGQERTKILSNLVEQLRSKNDDLVKQIQKMKVVEAAARRKCGQVFIKSLSLAQNSQFNVPSQENLYDDDAIISLYTLLKNNPPNLQKRFKIADKRGNNKLTIDQFTNLLQDLSMLPQDVMSMHRITGFAFGRKTLSLQQFKTILENRHKNRPMWQKKLIRKIKTIIISNGIKIDKFFEIIDKDGNGTIQASQLRKGLQSYNIFMNQNDWSNLFNLLDSDNSGTIDLNELKTLMDQQKTGKLQQLSKKNIQGEEQSKINDQNKNQGENNEQNAQNNQQNQQEQNKQQGDDQKKANQEENQDDQEQNKKQQNQNNENAQKEAQEQQQQQLEPYQQKNDQEQEGPIKLNGSFKIQIPEVSIPDKQNQKVYLRFYVNEDVDFTENMKLADLSKKKLGINTELNLVQYKIADLQSLNLTISVWASRQVDQQQNYLGQIFINLKQAVEKPKQWAINKRFKLTAEQFQKQVKGKIAVQIRWTPTEEQQQ